jgi:hypothetical protein
MRSSTMMDDRMSWLLTPDVVNTFQSWQVGPRLFMCTIVFSYGCLMSVKVEKTDEQGGTKERISIAGVTFRVDSIQTNPKC